MLLKKCICGEKGGEFFRYTNASTSFDVLVCKNCGMKRQAVKMDKTQLLSFYAKEYKEVYTHTWEQDWNAAIERFKQHKLETLGSASRVLDVGCGNGAFVGYLNSKGLNCVGTELSEYKDTYKDMEIYSSSLKDIHFPMCHFDMVCMHDVIEHVCDPLELIQEACRVLKDNGTLVLEIPDFSYEKHWKAVEHLWFFSYEDVLFFVRPFGFELQRKIVPIEGKITLYFKKTEKESTTILLPPGWGDVYWSFVKLQSFIKAKKIENPKTCIVSLKEALAPDRSLDFATTFPFSHSIGYARLSNSSPVWRQAYVEDGPALFENVFGCDYFLAYNGILRHGKEIDDVDKEWQADWFFSRFESKREKDLVGYYKTKYKKYIVVHHPVRLNTVFSNWYKKTCLKEIYKSYEALKKNLNCNIVLMGAGWDNTNEHKKTFKSLGKGFYSEVDNTDTEQAMALLKGSIGVFGVASGITILSSYFKKPTLAMWDAETYPNKDFWRNCVPPASRDFWSKICETGDSSSKPMNVVRAMKEAIEFNANSNFA